jgi:ABC-type glycerol-3-phosphate transport system permease component
VSLAAQSKRLLTWAAFVGFFFVVLFPIYIVVVASFTPTADLLSSPPEYLPKTLTLHNFEKMRSALPFSTYLENSLIFAIGSAVLSVLLAYLAAYAFARIEFPGRHTVFVLVLLSTTLPQIATVIPLFRLFRTLNLVNTRQGLIVLMSSALLPFTIWVLTSFIRQVPREIEEAARLDGARLWQIMFQIVAPLTLPALATLFLINFVITWNELFYPLVFATRQTVKPLTLGLVEMTQGTGTGAGRPWDLMSALAVVMIVPVIVMVTVFQRLFVRGLTQGAVK